METQTHRQGNALYQIVKMFEYSPKRAYIVRALDGSKESDTICVIQTLNYYPVVYRLFSGNWDTLGEVKTHNIEDITNEHFARLFTL